MTNPNFYADVKEALYDSPSRTFYLYIDTTKRRWSYPSEIYLNNSETLRVWIFELQKDIIVGEHVYSHRRPGGGTYYLKVYADKDQCMKAWNECRSG